MAGVQSDAQSQAPFFVPGRNVNTLGPILGPPPGGGPDPLSGNPYSKQRNEPSCDVSPYNQMVVLCAYNDYRGIPVFKDSWIGLSMTNNGGRTWFDRLLDGFPTSPQGIGAADPIVRTVPGLGVIAYITLDANRSRGTLSIAQMLEKNRENGEPYQFLQKFVIDIGNSGRFLDKPDMEIALDPAGGTINVGGRSIPKGRVFFSYAVFTGTGPNGNGASIYTMYSDDYGQTWSNPKKLSASLGANQGVDIGVDDSTGTVITTWRQIADNNQSDAIIFSRSTNNGATWSSAQPIWTAPSPDRFFDQATDIFQFRTLSMPAIVHDGTAFHAYFSARGFSDSNKDDARIVVSNSSNGLSWSAPAQISPNPNRGHQVVPQVAVGGGSIQVDWIDTRNNDPRSFDRAIADFRYVETPTGYQKIPLDAPLGEAPEFIYRNSADIYGVQAAVGRSPNYSDAQAISRYRFGLDDTGKTRQLEFNFLNARMYRTGTTPFHGDYHVIASQRYLQTDSGTWIRNAGPAGTNPNTGPMTNNALFYAAFPDNRDVRGFVWLGLTATPYTPTGTTSQEAEGGLENAQVCTPEQTNTAESTTEYNSANDAPRSRFQNVYAAPIYPGLVVMSPSGTKPIVGANERAYVVFVQNLNLTDTELSRTYRFSITNQPAGGRASFSPAATTVFDSSCVVGTNCQQIDVTIQRGSSATRTVYVKSTDPRPRIRVKVTENVSSNPQTGSVLLNGMPADIAIETPDIDGLPDVSLIEGYQPDLLSRSLVVNNALLINPDLTPPQPTSEYPRDGYPRDGYPRDGYPRDGYPRDGYPRDGYHSVAYPRDGYPRDGYPRDGYSRLGNSALTYSAISASDITPTLKVADLTWPVITAPPSTTDGTFGNTVTGMSAQIFINGTIPPTCGTTVNGTKVTTNCLKGAQLIVWVPHFYTAVMSCSGQLASVFDNQIILNTIIPPGDLAAVLAGNKGPNTVNPDLSQPTFWVGPKQVVFSTLRLFGELDETQFQNIANHTGTIVRSQPDTSSLDGSNDSQDGTIDTKAPDLDLTDLAATLAHVEGNTTGGANVSVTVTATDDSGSASVSCVRTQGTTSVPLPVDGTETFIPLGHWTGTCTAVDASGNQTTPDSFDINVEDKTPPKLDVSGLAATVTLTPSVDGAILSYNPAVVTVTDVVDSTVTVTCTPPVGSVLPAGAASITCSSTDKSNNTASATYSFTVGKATTTTTVTVANATYDGLQHGATAVVTGAGGLNQSLSVTYTGTGTTTYGPTFTAPTNAGTYAATATYAGSAGYEGSTDSDPFTIAKAASVTTVTCPASVPYEGVPVTPCSVSVTGAGGLSLSPTPVYTNNTNVGTATASYTYAGDANHTGSTDGKTFTITVPYGFVVVSFPTSGNQGSAIPMSWRYTLNGAPFNSFSLVPVFRAVQLTSCNPNGVETSSIFDNQYAPGNSNFQFTSTSPYTWQYNWQTKAFIKGACYNIYIVTKNGSGATLQKNLMGKVKLN